MEYGPCDDCGTKAVLIQDPFSDGPDSGTHYCTQCYSKRFREMKGVPLGKKKLTSRQKQLLDIIRSTPGLLGRDIRSRLNASSGSFQFLIGKLISGGLAKKIGPKEHWRYYLASHDVKREDLLHDTPRKVLRIISERGPILQSALTDLIQMSGPTISRSLSSLERDGWIERSRDGQNYLVSILEEE